MKIVLLIVQISLIWVRHFTLLHIDNVSSLSVLSNYTNTVTCLLLNTAQGSAVLPTSVPTSVIGSFVCVL